MIDISTESSLSLAELSNTLPAGRGGKKPSLGCILRWIRSGARNPSGQRVRLRAARIGGRWFCSREAVKEFISALTPSLDVDSPTTPRTSTSRLRAAQKAADVLEEFGI